MIEAARGRHGGVEGLSFEITDAAILPFDDARFDACRVDRVLQHVADPVPVVGEMFRVLRPGGVLVAYDNDWETLTVDATDRGLTRAVLNAWCDRFPSGWIGRRLVPLLLQAGLRDVVAFPKTLVLRDLTVADRLYCLFTTVGRLAKSGVVSQEDAARWAEELCAADARADSSARTPAFWCAALGLETSARRLDHLRSDLPAWLVTLGSHRVAWRGVLRVKLQRRVAGTSDPSGAWTYQG